MVKVLFIKKLVKYTYSGVNNEKWYVEKQIQSGTSSISRVNDETSFEEREKVYEENRFELQTQFRLLRIIFYLSNLNVLVTGSPGKLCPMCVGASGPTSIIWRTSLSF